jgi:SAM-dependent methyltransferase
MSVGDVDSYIDHWDSKFRSRVWGRYPPEDLVRFIGRSYKDADKSQIKILEIGSGTGANLWFLHREGFDVAGIDGSSAGVDIAVERLRVENAGLNDLAPDIRVGNFSTLPWADETFDVVIDVFALYANMRSVIDDTVSEIHRVLKPQGRVYSKLWGRNCTGYGEGVRVEDGTYDEIPRGVCCDMGVSHFVDADDIRDIFSAFAVDAIDTLQRTEQNGAINIEDYMCQCTKKNRS